MTIVDLLAVPDAFPCLADQLAVVEVGEAHVVAPEALVLMKLSANRPQDRADVARLLDAGVDERGVASYLAEHAPRFVEIYTATTDSQDQFRCRAGGDAPGAGRLAFPNLTASLSSILLFSVRQSRPRRRAASR
jgi:hypothetical protein